MQMLVIAVMMQPATMLGNFSMSNDTVHIDNIFHLYMYMYANKIRKRIKHTRTIKYCTHMHPTTGLKCVMTIKYI